MFVYLGPSYLYCLILVLRYKNITFHCRIVVYKINRTTLEYNWILPLINFESFCEKVDRVISVICRHHLIVDFMLFLLSYTRSVSVSRSKVLSLVSSTTSLFSSKRETRNLCKARISFRCLLYVWMARNFSIYVMAYLMICF